MNGRISARAVLAVLGVAAVALIVIELSLGALSFGETKLADPCTSKPQISEGGIGGAIDGAVQRFALSTLNGAACELGTTREELVLSFVPSAGTTKVKWDKATIEKALRSGMRRAARDVAGSGFLGSLLAFVLDNALARPLAFFLGQGAH